MLSTNPKVPPLPPAGSKAPAMVAWLGYGGLLPFLGLAVLVMFEAAHTRLWSVALVNYGAVILSFVGALHWGLAMVASALDDATRRKAFVWSVIPALIGWVATFAVVGAASLLLVAGFALHLIQDYRLPATAHLPAWYLPMRRRLTIVACLCLLANACCRGAFT